MKLKICNDERGLPRVLNAETGEGIDGIWRIEITMDARVDHGKARMTLFAHPDIAPFDIDGACIDLQHRDKPAGGQ